MCVAQSMPAAFYHDSFLSCFCSILNKNISVAIAGFEARSRFWVADTAEPGSGKSPAIDPIANILAEVLAANPDLAAGFAYDRFHMQEGTTHAVAADRTRNTDGYLLVASGEAGPLLCPSWPQSMTWNQTSHINLQKFLDAANGGKFMWETMFDRSRKKTAQDDNDVPRGISFLTTNVVLAMFVQISVFCKWFALSEYKQSIGLAPRFLFGFGASKPPGPTRYSKFVSTVAFPILRRLFTYGLKALGPKQPVGSEHKLRLWCFQLCHFLSFLQPHARRDCSPNECGTC